MTGCERWLVRTETVEATRRQYVPLPKMLTDPVPAPPAPVPRCEARDGKPTMCADQLDEWIQFGWARALEQANRDKELICCLQDMAQTGKKLKDC